MPGKRKKKGGQRQKGRQGLHHKPRPKRNKGYGSAGPASGIMGSAISSVLGAGMLGSLGNDSSDEDAEK